MLKSLLRRKSVERILQEAEQRRVQGPSGASLDRRLRVVDLTAFGIAAIVGAGIFSTVGQAAYNGGPAVCLLFVFVALACGFTAFCYAEFASMIPISGSAYTYAYASFGELIAWIIGWDLLLEYAIGNIAIAISWSNYFTGLLSSFGLELPAFMTMDFLTALRGHRDVEALLAAGATTAEVFARHPEWKEAYNAWLNAPVLGPLHIVADVPALIITIAVTSLIYVGIKESRNANNVMVVIKLTVILAVIVIGFYYVNPRNWD